MSITGFIAPGFAAVREAFAANFDQHDEVGAACCVYRHGTAVVDLCGGYADRERGHEWNADTLALVFPATKGLTAICIHRLVERGMLDLDAPVARYWPEFGGRGKEHIPLRWVLSHRAGLAAVVGELTLADVFAWDPVVAAIAAQAPSWEPGTEHGYHARSFGWILGEVVRRVTGQSLGAFFADEIAKPLRLDCWIGLPEDQEPRVAKLYPAAPPSDPQVQGLLAKLMGPDTLLGRVITGPSNLFQYDERWNRREFHAAEMPSSNGIASARALARAYAAVIGEVDGRRLLRAETVTRACQVEADGPDKVLHVPTRFGLGFMLPPALARAAAASAFGHPGAGGSLALADPDAGMSFAYVMNQMRTGVTGDPRGEALLRAVDACLRAALPQARRRSMEGRASARP